HFLLMLGVTLLTSVVATAVPFWGVMLYYSFSTLRPQSLWVWSLSGMPQVRWSLIAIVIALGATLLNLPTVLQTFKVNKVLILLCAYATLMLLSMLTAFNPDTSWFWAKEYGKVFVMLVIASIVIQRFWQVRAMALMIVFCLGYIAYHFNHMYFFQGGRLDIFHVGFAGLDNNGAAALLALGIPFAYFLAMSPAGRWVIARRIVGVVIGLMLLHAIMMSYSRGGMLAAAFGLVWLMINHRPRFQAAAVSLLLVVAIGVMAGDEIRDRAMSTTDYKNDESAQSRFDSWSAAWDIVWEHPILGKGIRNSNSYSQNYGADKAGRTIHNQYLQIAADSGVPAASLYIAMIGVGLYGLGRARKRCLVAEKAFANDPNPKGPHDVHELVNEAKDAGALCLAMQTGLLTFSFSSIFLSVELVELPWLLIALSGILPFAVDRRLEGLGYKESNNSHTHLYTPPPIRHTPNAKPEPMRKAA
ncbi:MAG: O-antigen ligase family protein, partial [Phycisphaeraceae bacterium]